jgi:hypothetical protein
MFHPNQRYPLYHYFLMSHYFLKTPKNLRYLQYH